MNTFSNSLISTVDRLIGSLGPINALVDRLVDRLAPRSSAQACSWNCYYGCLTGTCYTGPCQNGQKLVVRTFMLGRWDVPGCLPACGVCDHNACYSYQSC